MTLLGVDISHFQGSPNFSALKGDGLSFVFMKATQGTGYVDPQFVANRTGARSAGLIPGFYHFAANTDPNQEAQHFCSAVGSLLPGELVALDWEVASADPVGWSKTWLDVVTANLGVRPLVYLNQSTVNGFNWDPISGTYGLWLAKYDDLQTQVGVSHWSFEAIKQYWDKGTEAGIAGAVDQDVFFGDLSQLARYGKQAAVAPVAPSPAPPSPATPVFDVRAWRAHVGATGAVFAHLQDWANRMYPAYCHIAPTAPSYGPQTARFLAQFCQRQGVSSDGNDIGPKTAQLLWNAGFRG